MNADGRTPRPTSGRARGAGKWSALIEELNALGFRPSKARGQNFLFDDQLLDAIAADAQLDGGSAVLEVGPGCAVLTERLAPRASCVLAVELDPRLAEIARRRTEQFANVEVFAADALDGKHALHPRIVAWTNAQPRWSLVSNLPYSAGTPILVACSRLTNPPESMTVLLQRELVERIAAAPGEADWGALSAKLQRVYATRVTRRAPAAVFWPRPKVESAVVRLTLREPRPAPAELGAFDALVTHLFAQRRKVLRSRLAELAGGRPEAEAWCARAGIDGGLRPEVLSVEQLAALDAARAAGGRS